MNETIAKAIIGNMLRRTRIDGEQVQREIANKLGLANSNYLSMVEKGTNFIPLKRMWDFVDAYRLTKLQGLAAVKLTSDDTWKATLKTLKVVGISDKNYAKLLSDVDAIVQEEAKFAGVEIINQDK